MSLGQRMSDLANNLIKGADAAADYTGLTRRQIYHLVENAHIPVKRIGRCLYFDKRALARAFETGVVSIQ